jgi:hypothetical protein
VGPRVVLDAAAKRKIPSPRRQSNPRTPIIQPVDQRYTDWPITTHYMEKVHEAFCTLSFVFVVIACMVIQDSQGRIELLLCGEVSLILFYRVANSHESCVSNRIVELFIVRRFRFATINQNRDFILYTCLLWTSESFRYRPYSVFSGYSPGNLSAIVLLTRQ